MRSNMRISIAAAILATGLVSMANGAVVSAPFSDNFATAPGDLGSQLQVVNNRTGPSTWAAITGGARHTYEDQSWGVADAGAFVNVDNLPGDFVVQANVKPVTVGAFASVTGLVAASSTSAFGGWSSAYYAGFIRLSGAGTVETKLNIGIVASNSVDYPTVLASTASETLMVAGATYAMTLAGDFTATGLDLSFSVTEVGNPSFVPVVSSFSVATGDIFPNLGNAYGIRDEVQGGSIVLDYSNFSVADAVPEPASLGLLVITAAGLLVRRRA